MIPGYVMFYLHKGDYNPIKPKDPSGPGYGGVPKSTQSKDLRDGARASHQRIAPTCL